MLSKHASSRRKQRGILDPAACSDHASQNFGCWIQNPFWFEEIELLIDRSVDFLNSAASRLDFSCTLIQNSAAEQTCIQQPKTARNPRSSCMFRSCSAKFWLLDPKSILEASQGSSVLVDDAAYASGLAESLSPS